MSTRLTRFVFTLGAAVALHVGYAAPAFADDEPAQAIAEAAGGVDADCIAGAVAAEAIAAGVQRGRRLLARLGVDRARAAVTSGNPCATDATGASAAPPPAAAAPEQSSARRPFARALQQQPAQQRARNCGALGAGCADGMQPLVACMSEKTLWGEMANALEQKRNEGSGWSAEQVAQVDADIAALRAAHAADARAVEAVDPARPNRHFDWFTPEEYSLHATAAAATLNAHREQCNKQHSRF